MRFSAAAGTAHATTAASPSPAHAKMRPKSPLRRTESPARMIAVNLTAAKSHEKHKRKTRIVAPRRLTTDLRHDHTDAARGDPIGVKPRRDLCPNQSHHMLCHRA